MTIDYEPDAPPPRPMASAAGFDALMAQRERHGPVAAAVDEDRGRQGAEGEVPEPVAGRGGRAMVETQAFQAVYSIAGRVTVPATGEAKRVQIDEAAARSGADGAHRAQARPEGLSSTPR